MAVHHRWNDRLNLLGSVGWADISEFGRVQVDIDDNGIPGTTVDAGFRDVWNFGIGAEYQWKPDLELTAGFQLDTSMSTDRTRPIVIPLGSLYRYAIGADGCMRHHFHGLSAAAGEQQSGQDQPAEAFSLLQVPVHGGRLTRR